MHAVEAIRVGYVDVIVAGGTESMSNAPYLLKGARWGYRMGNAEALDSMLAEGLTCAIERCHMGVTAEEVASAVRGLARRPGRVRRREPAARRGRDRERARSTMRSCRSRFRRRKGAACACCATNIRAPGRPSRSSPRLKPAFAKDGTVTAGNASGINDGAAALVVASERRRRAARNARRSARILAYATTGVDPTIMGMGPVPAVRRRSNARGSAVERHRSLRAERGVRRAVARRRARARNRSRRVNVHGGAIALGHPIGASGARVLTTLVYALRRHGGRYGVASLCIGGGMGIAMVVERIA